jgi:hypothetical protein
MRKPALDHLRRALLPVLFVFSLSASSAELRPSDLRREQAVGAKDRQHWSYLPLRSVKSPAVKDAGWARTKVDDFILAALEAKGLRPNPVAGPRTLIRRVYFDVLGLPPTPEEVEAFAADPAPDAYDRLVDRVLASPHYGERWGRHWLDVARYADSDGMETDADRPTAYHYRDFVIRSLNDDLPYDTFVRWQLAGDEYEPDNPRALAATGFLAAAPTEVLSVPMEEERLRLRFNELDDMAATSASAFLGLTLGCARCHDHKYDAIPTRDYYRLQCAFTTTKRDQVLLASRADAARFHEQESEWDARLKAAQSKLDAWLASEKAPHAAALRDARIDRLPVGETEKKLLKKQPDSDAAKKLAKKHEKALKVGDDEYRRVFTEAARAKWGALEKELDAVRRSRPEALPTALAVVDGKPEPEPTYLLDRGNFTSKKEQLQVGFLTVLTGDRAPEDYWADARRQIPAGHSTGQRRALADWITDTDNGAGALLARVIVNRVWQHHFGEGLVRTVGDFGVRGEPPTHPELLEYLARELAAGGWRLKPLHRLILRSSAYMQAATFDPACAKLDPEDRLVWRRRPRRLEAEVLRDAILSVSGTLNLQPFGPAFKPPIPPEAMQARNAKDPYPPDARDTPETRRRSVYMFHKRVVQHPFMQAFDAPDSAVTCGRRDATTVAPQALALMNDDFVRDRAADFARRLIAERGTEPEAWVARAFSLALSRLPSGTENAASLEFINRQTERRAARDNSAAPAEVRVQALADFCQTLFGLNEFTYVD